MLLGVCQLVLEGMLLTTGNGEYRLASFVDEQRMSRLYEKFILEYFIGVEQHSRHLSGGRGRFIFYIGKNLIQMQRMSRLYEKFILEYFIREYPQIKTSAPQIPWALDDGAGTLLPVMQSDVVLRRGRGYVRRFPKVCLPERDSTAEAGISQPQKPITMMPVA